MDLRRMLKKLQAAVRAQKDVASPFGRYEALPENLRTDDRAELHIGPEIARQMAVLVAALLADPHYEHLGKAADAAVGEFVCYAAVVRNKDHVSEFLETHHADEFTTTIHFGVEYLTVGKPFDVYGVTFAPLPRDDTDIGRHLRHDKDSAAVASVEVSGSDLDRMVERARERAQHALRVLRVSLANAELLDESQLRFRLGQFYVASDRGHGFSRRRDRPVPLELPQPPAELIAAFTLLPIPFQQATEVGRQARLALGWIDAAHLAINPVQKVAFLFSALEAMLGDKSSGLKAPMLVYYRTLLAQVVRGRFPNPGRLYDFYDEVRSNAVHGEEVPEFTPGEANELEWTIRSALVELLEYCDASQLAKRSQVRASLLATEHARQTYDWLREYTPEDWWRKWSPWGTPDKGTCGGDSQELTAIPSEDEDES